MDALISHPSCPLIPCQCKDWLDPPGRQRWASPGDAMHSTASGAGRGGGAVHTAGLDRAEKGGERILKGTWKNHNFTHPDFTLGQYPCQGSSKSLWGRNWGGTRYQVLWQTSMGTFGATPDVPREIFSGVLHFTLY